MPGSPSRELQIVRKAVSPKTVVGDDVPIAATDQLRVQVNCFYGDSTMRDCKWVSRKFIKKNAMADQVVLTRRRSIFAASDQKSTSFSRLCPGEWVGSDSSQQRMIGPAELRMCKKIKIFDE
jgi:hypothetical protein